MLAADAPFTSLGLLTLVAVLNIERKLIVNVPTPCHWVCWLFAGNFTCTVDVDVCRLDPGSCFCSRWHLVYQLNVNADYLYWRWGYTLTITVYGMLGWPNLRTMFMILVELHGLQWWRHSACSLIFLGTHCSVPQLLLFWEKWTLLTWPMTWVN